MQLEITLFTLGIYGSHGKIHKSKSKRTENDWCMLLNIVTVLDFDLIIIIIIVISSFLLKKTLLVCHVFPFLSLSLLPLGVSFSYKVIYIHSQNLLFLLVSHQYLCFCSSLPFQFVISSVFCISLSASDLPQPASSQGQFTRYSSSL